MTAVVARVLLWAHARVAMYPGTRYLLLCANAERKSGWVTVGESRLPATPILGLIRSHGVTEAAIMWPQVSAEELSVLAQLAADIPAEARPEVDVLCDDIEAALREVYGAETPPELTSRVMAVLTQHGVIEEAHDG